MIEHFNFFLIAMTAIAVFVFITLFFVDAGYGMFFKKSWGLSINNKLGWFIMEIPVFVLMILMWAFSERTDNIVLIIFLLLFELHYLQRSFIFPFLMKGNSHIPLSVVFMGITFNIFNTLMQGGWLFYVSPADYYTAKWLTSPQFIIGVIIFLTGYAVNLNSDYIIRHLRADGDTKHYFPQKGMFRYVSSANYFGELVEWTGFAVLTWSLSGAVFALWTFANLAPRARRLNKKYAEEFSEEYSMIKPKSIIPFVY
ncbi:MAG: DUF1295 domain-containing protein [Bacteroidales bacterium]|jgi:3-oxo-5-alpha-steroid 4-dehydrogenase 1|nr:DUF1295 domain-containing protein [Bacteroidales bacterium]